MIKNVFKWYVSDMTLVTTTKAESKPKTLLIRYIKIHTDIHTARNQYSELPGVIFNARDWERHFDCPFMIARVIIISLSVLRLTNYFPSHIHGFHRVSGELVARLDRLSSE